jgi:hypothetical protein
VYGESLGTATGMSRPTVLFCEISTRAYLDYWKALPKEFKHLNYITNNKKE